MNEHQTHDSQQMPDAQPAAVVARGVSKSRRNLLRAGAIGAPALIVLKPAPVIACTCKLPSGFSVSGNASRGGAKNCADRGRRASEWTGSYCRSSSPNYYFSGGSNFNINKSTTVNSLGFSLGSYTGSTVDSWLQKGDSSDQGLMMACYLEAVAYGNDSNWPKKDKFVSMWNQAFATSGGYTPPNTVGAWDKSKVIAYLKFLTSQVA